MKRFIISLIILINAIPLYSQGWVFISGTVTGQENGLPVVSYPVTIFSDSINGFYYYNVVLTDSTGYYYDEVPVMADTAGMLFIQVTDCNGMILQAGITYNPVNNTFTQDFQICTAAYYCEANFSYFQAENMIFQFTDLSEGNPASWYWDFGDGTYSEEQNPFHQFPGPGTFEVCLAINGQDCADTSCQVVAISDTLYRQVYGQVFAGNFPLQAGKVMMYALNPNGAYTPLDQGCPVDTNGVYFFTLVPEGTYLIQAIPYDSTVYLPTYYGDVNIWQSAAPVVFGQPDNPYNINLVAVPAGSEYYGPGSLTGQINNLGLNRTLSENVNVLLLDESLVMIGFSRVSSSGRFAFPSLDYGTYHIRADLAGIGSENMKFEISLEKPDVEVVLNYTGNSVLGLESIYGAEEIISVYPNPATDRIFFDLKLSNELNLEIELISASGQVVFHEVKTFGAGRENGSIQISSLPAGFYMFRANDGQNVIELKRVVVSK